MTKHHNAIVQPLPSSILHNGTDVRRQYTRAAAQHVIQVVSRKIGSMRRKANAAAPDLHQGWQG